MGLLCILDGACSVEDEGAVGAVGAYGEGPAGAEAPVGSVGFSCCEVGGELGEHQQDGISSTPLGHPSE